MTTEINRRAPAVAHKEIEIAASPDTVWALHANIEAWPDWHADITAVDPDLPRRSLRPKDFTGLDLIIEAIRSRIETGGEVLAP